MQIPRRLVVTTDVECIAVERTRTEPKKLLVRLVLIGAGKSFKIFTATGDNRSPESDCPQMVCVPHLYWGFPYWGQKLVPYVRNVAEVCA